jgi:hypothetical protein
MTLVLSRRVIAFFAQRCTAPAAATGLHYCWHGNRNLEWRVNKFAVIGGGDAAGWHKLGQWVSTRELFFAIWAGKAGVSPDKKCLS